MKFCKNCNAINDNDAIFCKSCGARLNASNQAQTRTSSPPKMVKKKFPIKIVVAVIAIAATVFAASTVLTTGKNGRKDRKDIINQYVEACSELDGKKLLSLYPKELVEEIYEHSGISKEDVYRYYSNKLSSTAIFRSSLDGTLDVSFDTEEPYDYSMIQGAERRYRKSGFDFKIEEGKLIKYSSFSQEYGQQWLESNIRLYLIKMGGRWYIDDFNWQDFNILYGQDPSVIPLAIEGIKEQELIAKYLGCDQKRLRGPRETTLDGEKCYVFYYWDSAGNSSDYMLYLSRDGSITRVMARYRNSGTSIPVEELPEGERDNSWKIKFVDTAKQQEATTTPQETDIVEHDSDMISAFPDEDERKTPVIYYDTDNSEISEEEEKSLAAEQRPALIKYLGCSEDNLWAGYVVCTQGDVPKIGFWYVDDYEEISEFVILLEDGTAAWYSSDISTDGTHITGSLSVETIDRHAFRVGETADNLIDARKLSESEQKNLIAEYLNCDTNELTYYQTNQAQRMEFESTNDEISGLVFLLDDGTVAEHYEGEPPLRVEGTKNTHGSEQTEVSIDEYNKFMGLFGTDYDNSLFISEENGALSIEYVTYRTAEYEETFEANNWPDIVDNRISFETERYTVTLEYICAENSVYGRDTLYQYCGDNDEDYEIFVRIDS